MGPHGRDSMGVEVTQWGHGMEVTQWGQSGRDSMGPEWKTQSGTDSMGPEWSNSMRPEWGRLNGARVGDSMGSE